MNDSKENKNGINAFLFFILIVSVIGNIYFVLCPRQGQPKEIVVEKFPEIEMRQIREIAIDCGKDPVRVGNTSAKELLSDIKGMLMNAEPYYGSVLESDDLVTVRSYLNNKSAILKTIETQNKFLSDLKGKKILVLPQGDK